jgi:phage gp29-like protein
MARQPKTPTYNEIATIDNGRDIDRGYYLQPLLSYQDSILKVRGGNDLRIYETIARDDQVKAALEQRRNRILSWEWSVEPGKRRFMEATDQDQKAADYLRETLEAIAFDNIIGKMHWGTWYGYAVGELMYAKDGQYVVLDDTRGGIRVKRARRFRFGKEMDLRLITQGDRWEGESLDPMKFWYYSYGADNDDDPYGLGLAHYCYWPVTIKRDGIVAWMAFFKKFGRPFRLGKYQPGTSETEQQKLKSVVRAFGTDDGGIVPDGMVIELIESSRNGTADHSQVADYMDRAIAKIILGETMTLEAEGGQYKGDIHEQVLDSMCQTDSDLMSFSFVDKVVRPLCWYNRATLGEDVALPMVWRRPPEGEDVARAAKIYLDLKSAGFEPEDLEQVNSTFGGQWRRTGEMVDPLFDEEPEFAEGDPPIDQAELDAYLTEISDADLLEQLKPIIDPVLDRLVSGDTEGALEDLATIYPEMNSDGLVAILERAFFVAEVWGRINSEVE